MTPTYTVSFATAGDEKCTEPVGCRHATLPLFAHSDTTSPGPPDSLNVPMNTRSNATFGEEVMPLNRVCARRRVSHCTLPSEAFRRTTVPFDVPTKTERSKIDGDENPGADEAVQRMAPVRAFRAIRPCIVVTKSFPYATAGVAPISRTPVSRSQTGSTDPGTKEVDVPEFARSPRNSTEGCGSSGVGTGWRTSNVWESNPAS